MASKEEQSGQTFSFETMAVVLYSMLQSGVNLGMAQYDMMAAVDPNSTASAFQHRFRKVKARARELFEKANNGEIVAPTKASRGRKPVVGPSSSKKGSGKRAAKDVDGEDEDVPSSKKDEDQADDVVPAAKKQKIKEEFFEDDIMF